MFDIEANLHEFRMSSPPRGCGDEDLLRLIDLCPFLASEKSQYNDSAVLNLLKLNPSAACLRHSYRCGIGNTNQVHPLALVVALGGSLEVIQLMVKACPEALDEKLSGRRNVLHYAIAEGVDVEIIQYLTTQNPALVSEVDSFEAIPLHLASTYPSSSPLVLQHLLYLYPEGAKAVDYRYLTPLHRACKSRASLDKVLPLVEAYPQALFLKDGGRNTPLGWAERMDHSLSDAIPEVVQILEMMEDILTMTSTSSSNESNLNVAENEGGIDFKRQTAKRVLWHLRSIEWWGGIQIAFATNSKLLHMLDLPMGCLPELLALIGSVEDDTQSKDRKEFSKRFRMQGIFSILIQCPDVF